MATENEVRTVHCDCGAMTTARNGVYDTHFPTTLAYKPCEYSGKSVRPIVGKVGEVESQWNALFQRK